MSTLKATFSPVAHLLPNPAEWGIESHIGTIAIAILGIILGSSYILRTKKDGNVYDLGGIPIVTAWTFFTKRWDFLCGHFAKTRGKMFRFRVMQHRVIALNGEQSRKMFFNEKSLDFQEGYNVLMGGFPDLGDISVESDRQEKNDEFIKRILMLIHKDKLVEAIPFLLDDVNNKMLEWGKEGTMNPFKDIYEIVFQMTVRMATCKELADDKQAVEKLAQYYWNIEKSATPFASLLPWFPGSAKKTKEKATMGLYHLIGSYVKLHREAPTPSTDPIDVLMAQGISDDNILGTIIAVVFTGVINTGINSCWALLYLDANPTWKQRAFEECTALVLKHTNTLSSEPLHKRLATIPLDAWENELPSVELIIRETIRMTVSFAALRRNVGKEFGVEDVVIKRRDFLLYSLGRTHMDPEIYPEPTKFDPDRYLEGREEDRQQTYAYLGWGAGRHTCVGVKMAKLQMKLVLALMLLGYEYELVDGSGKYPASFPQPDRNDIQQARPLGDSCYLKFKRVMEA